MRGLTRDALLKKHESFSDLNSALKAAQSRMTLPTTEFIRQSALLEEIKHQRKLSFFS